jgi:hypothetical protein
MITPIRSPETSPFKTAATPTAPLGSITSFNRSNAKHYDTSSALTNYHEFPGRAHYTLGQPGWEQVADYALRWALEHATAAGATTSGQA